MMLMGKDPREKVSCVENVYTVWYYYALLTHVCSLYLGGSTYNGGKSSHSSAVSKPASAPVHAKVPAASSNVSVASKLPAKPSAAPVPAAATRNSVAAEQENDAQANNRSVIADSQKEIAALKQAAAESARAYAELRGEMDGLEKERDFYFEKLRDIEIVLQDLEDKGESPPISAHLFKILYATADGFEPAAVTDEPAVSVDVFPENASSYDEPAQESY